jgi:hypothetical protein
VYANAVACALGNATDKHRRANVQALLVACVYANAVARAASTGAQTLKHCSWHAYTATVLHARSARGTGVGFSLELRSRLHSKAAAVLGA